MRSRLSNTTLPKVPITDIAHSQSIYNACTTIHSCLLKIGQTSYNLQTENDTDMKLTLSTSLDESQKALEACCCRTKATKLLIKH